VIEPITASDCFVAASNVQSRRLFPSIARANQAFRMQLIRFGTPRASYAATGGVHLGQPPIQGNHLRPRDAGMFETLLILFGTVAALSAVAAAMHRLPEASPF
jgi:hypothetical protein